MQTALFLQHQLFLLECLKKVSYDLFYNEHIVCTYSNMFQYHIKHFNRAEGDSRIALC